MATRTLGIKYEIRGYKEAVDSLKNLRLGIKKNQQANQELSEQQIKNSKKVAAIEKQNIKPGEKLTENLETRIKVDQKPTRYTATEEKTGYKLQAEIIGNAVKEAIESSNDDIFSEYAEIFQKFKQGNATGGLAQLIKRPINSIVAGYYEAIGGEFGSRVGQRLLGTRESSVTTFKNRSSNLFSSSNSRNIGITVKLSSENMKDLVSGLSYSLRNNNNLELKVVAQTQGKSQEKQGNIFTKVFDSIASKFSAISSGYYEGIGNYFGEQFASGFSEVLEEELDYSQKRKGRIFGKSVSFVAQDGLDNLDEKFNSLKYTIADLADETQDVDSTKIKNFLTALTGIPNSLVDSYLTGFRRASVQEEATRRVDASNAQFNEELENIENYQQAIITASGFAGNQGQQGRIQAEQLRELNEDEGTVVLSSDTAFTDVLFQPTDAVTGAAWGVNAVANAAKINLKGFNPDSVELVNKVLALREKNPEIKIKLVGHSAGGFVTEEAQYLLELLGVENVSTVTAGTPNLKGNIKAENIQRIFAEDDPLEALHQAGSVIDFVNDDTQYDSVPEGHFFDQYLASENVRRAIFGDLDPGNTSSSHTGGGGDSPDTGGSGDSPDSGGSGGNSPDTGGGSSPNFGSDSIDFASQINASIAEIQTNFNAYIQAINEAITNLQQSIIDSLNPGNIVGNIRASRLATEGQAELQRTLENQEYDAIDVNEGVETLVAIIGGYAGMQGRSGQLFANKLQNIAPDDKTQYVGLTNQFSDVISAEDFNAEDEEGARKSIARILAMFAEVHQKGYNPDSVKAAAEIIQLQEQNPELNIKVAGYSGGGYVAQDVIKLLEDYGANLDNIEVMGIGTPNLPGGVRTEGFDQILGESDPILQVDKLKELNRRFKEVLGFDLLPELTEKLQNIEGINSHDLDSYVFLSEEVQRFLYSDIDKIQALASIYQDLNKAQESVGEIGLKMREVQSSNLNPETKLQVVQRLRNEYIKSLIEISSLTGQAVELGGGRYFSRQQTQANQSLARFGINYNRDRVETQREPDLTPEQLRQEYADYLDNLTEAAREHADELITAFVPNYDELPEEERKAYFRAIRQDIEELANYYRETLESGDLQLAREIGEKLLERIQAVRSIYEDLREASGTDPSLAANMGQLTSIETEIRRGQPNLQGRANLGLEDLFQQELEEATEAGTQITEGFVGGILEDLQSVREAAAEITDEVTNTTRDNLEIESPSQVFRRIGYQIVEGLNLGISETELEAINDLQDRLTGIDFDLELGEEDGGLLELRDRLENELNQLIDRLNTAPESTLAETLREQIQNRTQQLIETMRTLIDSVNESNSDSVDDATEDIEEQSDSATGILANIRQRIQDLEETYPILRRLRGVLAPIAALFLGGLGIKAIIGLVKGLSSEFLQAAMAAETMERSIIFSSRNAVEGAKNLEFVTDAAENLDINVSAAQKNYSSLIGAAKNTSLEGIQTEQIFAAFAETAALRGIDAQSQDRLFTALSQIIAKRKLTAEEVRGQIGDIAGFGDFMGLVAEAQGVSTSQLEEMMSKGELKLDILPKVAAILRAKNSLASSTETAQALQTRYNNSLNKFQVTLGKIIQPLQKLTLRIKAFALNLLTDKLELLTHILINSFLVVILALFKNVQLFPLMLKAITLGINGIVTALGKLWAAKAVIAQFLGAWLLVSLAIAAATNAFKVWRNKYQESYQDIDKLTKGLQSLKEAWHEANKAQVEYSNNLPRKTEDLNLAEGLKLPENWLGNALRPLVGGDRLNLDNLVRKRLVGLEISAKTGIRDLASATGIRGLEERYNSRLENRNFKTLAEKNANELTIAISDYNFASDNVLLDNYRATNAAEEIAKLDSQIAEIQAQRLDLLPGDKADLEKSLEIERNIQKDRDKQLKILTLQEQNLQLIINAGNKELENLAQAKLTGSITGSNYETQKAAIDNRIDEATSKLKDLKDIIARIPKELSEFERRLRNANERVSGFMENRDRVLQQDRTQAIVQGIEQDKGERVIQFEIEQLETKDLSLRINEVSKEIARITKDLRSPELAEGVRRVQESAASQGLELTTETINRMLEEERDSQEKQALQGLQNLRNLESQLFQLQEQSAQNLQQSRNNLIDFNRTINDYFFNLQQRIKEAQVETERLVKQIFYQDIKSQLRRAIAPGSESFINGIIDGVQSLLDQAQQIFEQKLGLRSSKLQFQSEVYSNENEMEDFIRQVKGASDALLEFRNYLSGDNSSSNAVGSNSNDASNQTSNIVTSLRRAIFEQESGANFKAVNPDSGALGYGQVMPANVASWTKEALGRSLTAQEFLNNPEAQIKTIDFKLNEYLQRELKATGNNLDLAVRRVASTWYSGNPNLYNKTNPQQYGANEYPSIDSYTSDILQRFKQESGSSAISDFEQRAIAGNQAFKSEKLQQLNLQEIFNSFGIKDLETTVADQKEKIRRQFQIEELQQDNKFAELLNKVANLQEQSVRPNANIETQRELRQVASEFRNFKFEGLQEVQALADELATIEGVLQIFPDAIAKIRASGSQEALAVLPVLEQILSEAQQALPQVQTRLEETRDIYQAIADEEAKRVAFIEEQGKLKKRIEKIRKSEELQQLRSNIVAQRGTNEQRRQNELATERLRLEKRIAEIKLQYGNTDQAQELIKLEKENSAIAESQINFEAYNRDLSYEQELLHLDSGIKDRKAEFTRYQGFDYEANRIQRENAIAQENFRYKQQIAQLEQQYAGEPERLEKLKRKAQELNQVNLESINQQFKDLGMIIRENALGEFQNFFGELVKDFDNVGNLLLKMLGNIANRISEAFAKRASRNIFDSIFGSTTVSTGGGIFGAIGNIFAGLFKAGGTVPNYDEGGTVDRFLGARSHAGGTPARSHRIVPTPISDRLQELSAPIRNAFRREGSGGRLAVFTPGEEILSIKTGEAGRYQGLKRQLGVNPLEKIFAGNFLDGGSIEANLLAGLDYKMPTINVAAIEGRERVSQPNTTQVYNLSSTFVTPDLDSFKASEYQIQQEQLEQLRRMNGRRQ